MRLRFAFAWPYAACFALALVPTLLVLVASQEKSAASAPPVAPLATLGQAESALHRAPPVDVSGPVLVIDVDANRFGLYDADRRLVRSGPCSTGSNATLRAADGRTWTFRTPRGRRRVHHKAERPVWYRPDWAYVEESENVPARDDPGRWVTGLLGAYGIDIGGGYLIHGSPWRRGIGDKNTHGCIRLLDDDLACVYQTLRVGDAVILF